MNRHDRRAQKAIHKDDFLACHEQIADWTCTFISETPAELRTKIIDTHTHGKVAEMIYEKHRILADYGRITQIRAAVKATIDSVLSRNQKVPPHLSALLQACNDLMVKVTVRQTAYCVS